MTQQITTRGQRRRQALLDAATHTFLQHGYARTTLDMTLPRRVGRGVVCMSILATNAACSAR